MRVEVSDAAVSFGDRRVFAGIHATFGAGKVNALVGPSGSGKSTLLGAIAGYQPLDSGTISIIGDDGVAHSPDASLVAWVPQGLNALGARTALDNVMIGALASGSELDDAREEAIRCLIDVGLDHRRDALARQLSGGELQRLALARALASKKPLILADEPSANLDAENTANVASVLSRLSGHSTLIVATHDPVLLEGADHVVDLRA